MHTPPSAPLAVVGMSSARRCRCDTFCQGSAERLDHILSRRSLSLSLVLFVRSLGMGMVPMCYLVTSCSIGEDQKTWSPLSPPVIFRVGEYISVRSPSPYSLFNWKGIPSHFHFQEDPKALSPASIL